MTKNDRHKDAEIFAEILRKKKLPNEITIGKFILKGTKGVKDKIQYRYIQQIEFFQIISSKYQ